MRSRGCTGTQSNQARGARLELASKVHTHWKRKAPLTKRHIPGMHDREPDNGQANGRGGARAKAARRKMKPEPGLSHGRARRTTQELFLAKKG